MVEVSRWRLKTIYREKSAEAIAGNLKKVAEGLHNVTVQTAQRLGGKIQADTKEADKPKPVHDICSEGTEAKLDNQGMDKLLCVRLYENSNGRGGRTFAYKNKGNHLEAMESTKETAVGIAEVGNRKRYGETDIIHGRPLSMGSDDNICSQGNLQRKAVTGRACQLLRLLFRTPCFEVYDRRAHVLKGESPKSARQWEEYS